MKDIARISSLHCIYLKDFGERIREPWNGELSNTMNAYLLYLLAVQDRQQGRQDRARRLLKVVAETKTLMPDLYRSKAHHHLGQMAEERMELETALRHYLQCLKRTPHHADAKQRIQALRGGNENVARTSIRTSFP